MKRFTSFCLCLLMVLGMFVTPVTVHAAGGNSGTEYYQSQLATAEARSIYRALAEMRDSGYMKNGVYTIDLVKDGFLQNKSYSKDELTSDFYAAKDAFMLDNAALFYVDYDKLSITLTQTGSNYSILLGIGRDTTYFREGFDASSVGAMVKAFDNKVNAIASDAMKHDKMSERVKAAFDGVINTNSYALEHEATPGNEDYVRTPYGALVRGQSVCEGYARALKAVLDKMGIESVLVQGTFSDGGYSGLHMWNYVRMDTGRWFLLDATMEDGLRASTDVSDKDDFFLATALEDVTACYLPEGKISLSSLSTTFRYPDLGTSEYTDLTNAFTAELVEGYTDINKDPKKVSYKGKGILATKASGKYILASYSPASGWYYLENYHMYVAYSSQIDPNEMVDDFESYFVDQFGLAYFAVTEKAPPAANFGSNYLENQKLITYNHGEEFIEDISQVGEEVVLAKKVPYVVSRTPADSRVEANKSYDITVKYSEPLQLANAGSEASVKLTTTGGSNVGSVTNFKWEDGSDTISFTLTTGSTYGYNVIYNVQPVNLVNVGGSAPGGTSFNILNTPVFSCPKVASSINKIHSTVPALISDSNLADNDWKDANGNSIENYASNRLALVASPIPETSTEEGQVSTESMVDEIEKALGDGAVQGAQTFDISLTLCSGQVDYITGKRVKVFVPFPAGYDSTNYQDYSFKAYHFKDDGTAEEIDCVVTESGIIMMCNSFSPFAVVALEKEAVTKKTVMPFSDGNGSFSEELIELDEGKSVDVKVTAKEGYTIEQILLNGNPVNTKSSKVRTIGSETTITLNYDELNDNGNTLEATFAVPNVTAGGTELVVAASTPADVTLNTPANGWKVDTENTFTLESAEPCMVLVSENDGRTYTRLIGTANQSFTATITTNTTITVVKTGDANMDGTVNSGDALLLKQALLNHASVDALEKHMFDLNRDGQINILDLMQLKAATLDKFTLTWD